MSGICGIFNLNEKPVSTKALEEIIVYLKYLGRDECNIWVDDYIGFGHTLHQTTYESKNEKQPFSFDGKIYITSDSRIDGRDELISNLKLKGRNIGLNTTDAQLILHSYYVWEEDCLKYLLGDFSFCIWDSFNKKLFCARDQLGIKDFYYVNSNNTLIFSNTIYSLQNHSLVDTAINDTAIGDFLLFGEISYLDKSMTPFKNIYRLSPGNKLTCQDGKIVIQKYWDFPVDIPLLKYKKKIDYIEHFQALFKLAVKDRMRTDKIIISMSGGMDSTSVAAVAKKIAQQDNTEIVSFCAIFESIIPDQEKYYSSLVAEKLDIPIKYFSCDNCEILAQPVVFAELNSEYTLQTILEMIKIKASLGRVELTGVGADNLLPHSTISFSKLLKEMSLIDTIYQYCDLSIKTRKLLPLKNGLLQKLFQRNKRRIEKSSNDGYPRWLNLDFESRLNLKDRWNEYLSWRPETLNKRYPHINKNMVFPDWTSTKAIFEDNICQPEVRHPFLDLRVINFVLSLPPYPWFFHKYILRQFMRDSLPVQVLRREKTPLAPLHNKLLQKQNTDWLDNWIPNDKLIQYVNRKDIPPISKKIFTYGSFRSNIFPLILNLWLNQLD